MTEPFDAVPIDAYLLREARHLARWRRFELHRDIDATGVSGTGVVARGAQFDRGLVIDLPGELGARLGAGWCAMRWATAVSSLALYQSIADVETIHGHNGQTRVVWLDPEHVEIAP